MTEMRISTNRDELDIPLLHHFISVESSWGRGIPRATLQRALENSLCFGGYVGDAQVAFGRVVSDYATFANLVDVFVLPAYRGIG